MLKKIKKGSVLFILLLFFQSFNYSNTLNASNQINFIPESIVQKGVGGALDEQLTHLNSDIKDIQNQKQQLQSQIDSNSYTIQGYTSQLTKLYADAQIANDNLRQITDQVKATQTQIDILNEQINLKKSDVQKTLDNVNNLTSESTIRISNNYINYRLYGDNDNSSIVLNVNSINKYFASSVYKEIIQSQTNEVLVDLTTAKLTLQTQEDDLNNKLIQVKKALELVQVQEQDLSKNKEDSDIKVANYLSGVSALQAQNNNTKAQVYALSSDEAQKQAQANKLQQEILNSYSPVSQGQYVVAGTFIGRKGCTGLCTGAHLHFMVFINGSIQNACNYLPSGVVDNCGINNSDLSWPLKGDMTLTSGFGHRCFIWGGSNYCDFHSGIDLVSNPWNAPIFAVHNGYVHQGRDSYGANYVILCENANCSGRKWGFWHLSSFS